MIGLIKGKSDMQVFLFIFLNMMLLAGSILGLYELFEHGNVIRCILYSGTSIIIYLACFTYIRIKAQEELENTTYSDVNIHKGSDRKLELNDYYKE